MPSGRTHDRITWWTFPLTLGGAWWLSGRWDVTSAVGASFLFSGFMFGPDLDTRSVQVRRWGLLHWIWWPYRRFVPHRSRLSHGVLVGTFLRLVYLTIIFCVLAGLVAYGFQQYGGVPVVREIAEPSRRFAEATYPTLTKQTAHGEWKFVVWILLGLELGAISHIIADTLVSSVKRQRKRLKVFRKR
jgi:uncharacterized metal-binding protein